MITIRRCLLLLLALLVVPGMAQRAAADGMVFKRPLVADDPWIPDQRALLNWMDGEETLVIETSVNGGGEDLAWVVPMPSVPEVEEAPAGLFPLLAEAFGPRLKIEDPWWIMILSLTVLSWWSLRQRSRLHTRIAAVSISWTSLLILMSGWELGQTLAVLCLLVFVSLMVTSGTLSHEVTAWKAFVWVAILVIGSALIFFVNMVSYGKLMAGVPGGVKVLGITQAGRFDVTVLKAEDKDSLADWMKTNDFHFPAAAGPAVEAYVREGWVFAAMKVRREGERGSGPLHPVTFRFKSDKPVYPMRLTASATQGKPLALDLFVFGPSSAAVPGMESKRSSLTYPDRAGPGLDKSSGRTLANAHLEIRRWFGDAKVGTWLRGVLPVDQLSKDVLPAWTENSLHDPEATTLAGAVNAVLNRASLALAALAFLLTIQDRRKLSPSKNPWPPIPPELTSVSQLLRENPFLVSLTLVALVWSVAYSAFLDITPVRRGSTGLTRSFAVERDLATLLYSAKELAEQIQTIPSEKRKAAIVEEVRNSFGGMMPPPGGETGGTPSVFIQEGSKGTELWVKTASGARVHMLTLDGEGQPDCRLGRIPLWELPRGTADRIKW